MRRDWTESERSINQMLWRIHFPVSMYWLDMCQSRSFRSCLEFRSFLISNTVTMGITVRKEEIAIMKYIGAKDFVVRSPFVLEGLIIGIVGAVLPLALLYALLWKSSGICDDKIQILKNIVEFLPVGDVYRYLLPIGLLLGVGIGFLGSFFTVRKHLKV